jgi:hypothetical protein
VDDRGAPLSIVVTEANGHGTSQTNAVFAAPPGRKRKTRLCADAAHHGGGRQAEITERHGYVTARQGQVRGGWRKKGQPKGEGEALGGVGGARVARQVQEAAARFEKLGMSYIALCHLAAAIIVFRKIGLPENIIYG